MYFPMLNSLVGIRKVTIDLVEVTNTYSQRRQDSELCFQPLAESGGGDNGKIHHFPVVLSGEVLRVFRLTELDHCRLVLTVNLNCDHVSTSFGHLTDSLKVHRYGQILHQHLFI